jgi:predicted RNA-binding Zn-ribbon protein involved in translation (DUF1610 family)
VPVAVRGARIYAPSPPVDTTTNWPLAPRERGVAFPCPNCGKTIIVRSARSRKLGVPYRCPECGFEGP